MTAPVVDPHQHFWDTGLGRHPWLAVEPPPPFRYGDTRPLRRPYLPDDYFADARRHGVAKTVYVEAEWDPADPVGEMRWVERLRAATGFPTAAVAACPLDRDDAAAVLATQRGLPFVRGIRHKPRANAGPRDGAPGGMADPRWRAGYARLAGHGLRFDLQTPWWHLGEAARLAGDYPATPIILNHTGLPADRSAEGIAGWRHAMAGLARCANVAVKISGLGVPGQAWTADANRDIVLATIELFGVDRCMFASNFPVDGLVASFDAIYSGFRAIVASCTAAERRRLFHDNAVRIYALD